ncbi:MAG: hypothetical protein IKN12_12365 [Selenomonadaceae bacterium]|nr:hypothetical protein [Selenomonadaceae bacterium]
MTNADAIRTLDAAGIANLILCVKCWVGRQHACTSRYDCPKWREFVEWLSDDVEVVNHE